MHIISRILKDHYTNTFDLFGATPQGVDWGSEEDVFIRYNKMLSVVNYANSSLADSTILDVGCGYGGLLLYAKERGIKLNYTGIDVADNIIQHAQKNVDSGNFISGDILDENFEKEYDFVICNGILTQKCTASKIDTDKFSQELIRKMFSLSRKGIAFNLMTTNVNFMVDNLYYRSPVEMLGFCYTEISQKFVFDHSYPLYEYTIYLFK